VTHAVRARIAAFLVLSAVGIVYVAGTYLGLVDRVLGRGLTVHAELPASGGLFEGSEVTYRGVKVGTVRAMHPTREGVRLDLALEEGTQLPADSALHVHNLSAVGEQYLDFEPPDASGPFLDDGDTIAAGDDALPVDEADLLVSLDRFVSSVDRGNLQAVVKELGLMFHDTGQPLERLIDNGSRFVDEAAAHEDQTSALLRHGLTVLRTQDREGENIVAFSRDLRRITGTLRHSDRDLRGVLEDTPATARELDALLTDLEPTLPVLLGNAISVNQVVVSHLAGVEQLLVTFPRTISSGFTGTPAHGGGRVNLQFANKVPPCTEGYRPSSQWRRPDQTSDAPIYPARCLSGPPYNMRGGRYAPDGSGSSGSAGRAGFLGSYDPRTGVVEGAVDGRGRPVRFVDQGDLSILGGDAWKWLLVGPVAPP
jgi:phospholipid/cholesterol/gamma-HCH transport system substrate-binding protein